MDSEKIRNIVEAALLAAGRPLKIDELIAIFGDHERPGRDVIRETLDALRGSYDGRGIELKEVASGFRVQVRQDMSDWLSRLWTERPPRYSRALLETLALIAYRQPITRGDIEDIRGVSVSTNIIRTLMERQWVRIVGHRDVPGRPAMYATTREFLDYFGLKRLDDLPSLAELRDFESFNVELDLADPDAPPAANDEVGNPDDVVADSDVAELAAPADTASGNGPPDEVQSGDQATPGDGPGDPVPGASDRPEVELDESDGVEGAPGHVTRDGDGVDASLQHAQDRLEPVADDADVSAVTAPESASGEGAAELLSVADHVEGEGESADDEPEEDSGQAKRRSGG